MSEQAESLIAITQSAHHNMDDDDKGHISMEQTGSHGSAKDIDHDLPKWAETTAYTPMSLRQSYWMPLAIVILALGMVLFTLATIVSLYDGIPTWLTWLVINVPDSSVDSDQLTWYNRFNVREHMLTTILPSAAAFLISAGCTSIYHDVRHLQPYLNIRRGDHTTEKTVFLKFSSTVPNMRGAAFKGGFILLTVAMLSVIELLRVLSGSLLVVQDLWWPNYDSAVQITSVGQANESTFLDMLAFQSASDLASAAGVYPIASWIPFITSDGLVLQEFNVPLSINGTVYANNQAAVNNTATCVPPTTNMTVPANNDTSTQEQYHVTASFDSCQVDLTIDNGSHTSTGVITPTCSNNSESANLAEYYQPVVFWSFSFTSTPPTFLAVQCTPLAAIKAVMTVVGATDNITYNFRAYPSHTVLPKVIEDFPLTYNGLFFNQSNMEPAAISRLGAIQEQLPSAMFEAALQADQNGTEQDQISNYVDTVQGIYNLYLMLIAKSIYFVGGDDVKIPIEIETTKRQLYLVPSMTYLCSALLISLALLIVLVERRHRKAREFPLSYQEHGNTSIAIPQNFESIAGAWWVGVQTGILSPTGTHESAAKPILTEEEFYEHLRDNFSNYLEKGSNS